MLEQDGPTRDLKPTSGLPVRISCCIKDCGVVPIFSDYAQWRSGETA